MRKPRFVLVFAALVSSLALGCGKSASAGPSGAAKEGVAEPVAAPASTASPLSAEGDAMMIMLGAKLREEARHRPEGTPKAEDFYAALERDGAVLTEKVQHVGSVFGADYCLGAKGNDDVAYSLCEFPTEDAAKAGRKASLASFASVPNRAIFLRKKSMLTVRQPPTKTPASEDASAKAARVFASL